jgi:ABC-type cobalamin/Fe3+-siderophores transport system ATPase subunit
MNIAKETVVKETSIATQRYQKYIKDLAEWEQKRKMILGEIGGSEEGSIKSFTEEKDYIEKKLDEELESSYSLRIKIISEIYDLHLNNCQILISIYKPIEEKLKKILANMDEGITFDVQVIANSSLKDDILLKIDQRVQGFFQGKNEGASNINNLIASTKFDKKESVIEFISNLYQKVTEKIDNTSSLLKEDEINFYNYIGSLNYLDSQYTLKLGNKNLKELSPGERGIVLLIFYLALNKSDIPLIIDQPEDNLDNQSVFNKLVPCIKEAKKHRQIIIVTHNPNIAIACDSEQIIYCDIIKKTNEIKYECGSIENSVIKEHVIDVLEGTMPAFDLRRQKYII